MVGILHEYSPRVDMSIGKAGRKFGKGTDSWGGGGKGF
jgi:hypothetical protein